MTGHKNFEDAGPRLVGSGVAKTRPSPYDTLPSSIDLVQTIRAYILTGIRWKKINRLASRVSSHSKPFKGHRNRRVSVGLGLPMISY